MADVAALTGMNGDTWRAAAGAVLSLLDELVPNPEEAARIAAHIGSTCCMSPRTAAAPPAGEAQIAMADGTFQPSDLSLAVGTRALRASAPLVFLNACHTMRQSPRLTARHAVRATALRSTTSTAGRSGPG